MGGTVPVDDLTARARIRAAAVARYGREGFGVGLRVIAKDRLGFAYTSDFDPDTLDAFVDRALQLAEAAAPNKQNGLPTAADLKVRSKVGNRRRSKP